MRFIAFILSWCAGSSGALRQMRWPLLTHSAYQAEAGGIGPRERLIVEASRFQPGQPLGYHSKGALDIEPFVNTWILLQIRLSQSEERRRRLRPAFLQMDECTRQLNEALVEESIGPLPLAEPKLLQHFVRLVEELPIKALEVPQIMGVKVASSKLRNQSRNLGPLGAHAQIINAPTRKEKREEGRGRMAEAGGRRPEGRAARTE